MTSVSVIIPTYNEAPWIGRLLHQLNTMKSVVSEIFVVDNWSSDATREIATSLDAIILDGGTPGVARNRGAEEATSEVVVFIDADVLLDAELLQQVIRQFEDAEVVAVHAKSVPITEKRFLIWCFALMDLYIAGLTKLGRSQGVATFLAVRRASFLAIGGFDESLAAGEDADIHSRLVSHGRVRYIRDKSVFVSMRRMQLENSLSWGLKYAGWSIIQVLGLRNRVPACAWYQYPEAIATDEQSWFGRRGIGFRR